MVTQQPKTLKSLLTIKHIPPTYTVYQVSINNVIIYIGRTNNLNRRIKEHLKLFKQAQNAPTSKDKQLYRYCIAEGIELNTEHFRAIREHSTLVEAKRSEMFEILRCYFKESILNSNLQQTIPNIKDGW